VLLLSRPLPRSIPLPASAQPFFLWAFEKANQTPSVKSFKPVYSMLNGACRNLLNQVPPETRQQFDEELCKILRSHNTGQDSMLLLWCVGIAILAEETGEAGQVERSFDRSNKVTALDKHCKTESGRKLFGSKEKLQKTMLLTCLSVLWAMKDDVGIPEQEAIEGIRIAVRMVQSVDRAALQDWSTSSPVAKGTFRKLPDKIGHVNMATQLEAAAFYATIAGEGNISSDVVAQYERCTGEIASVVDADCLGESLSISLPLFAVSTLPLNVVNLLTV